MERDAPLIPLFASIPNFNSHAHVERDYIHVIAYLATRDFNSHAHVERDEYTKVDDRQYIISTHTLTWSVTNT